jgi:hypothetical protein
MTTFYAQPYDISATGFYFDTTEQFDAKIRTIKNDYGQPVEEFEISLSTAKPSTPSLPKRLGSIRPISAALSN